MKTLDEVIVELENYPVVGGTTLTFDVIVVPERSLNDALHYLKEYKTLQYSYIKAMADLEDNPPLTWDELRLIDEKPIWIEVKNGEKKWVITCIDPDDVDRIYITDAYGLRGILNMKMYFKGEIKAYRKERK